VLPSTSFTAASGNSDTGLDLVDDDLPTAEQNMLARGRPPGWSVRPLQILDGRLALDPNRPFIPQLQDRTNGPGKRGHRPWRRLHACLSVYSAELHDRLWRLEGQVGGLPRLFGRGWWEELSAPLGWTGSAGPGGRRSGNSSDDKGQVVEPRVDLLEFGLGHREFGPGRRELGLDGLEWPGGGPDGRRSGDA